MLDTSNPTVQYLLTLKHSPKTDLKAGKINNQDAIILLFHALGPFGAKVLLEFSNAWRGSKTLSMYFGPHYGYTGTDFFHRELYHSRYGYYGNHTSGAPKHPPFRRGPRRLTPWPPPFWYRMPMVKGKPYTNAITGDGMRRLAELLSENSAIPQ